MYRFVSQNIHNHLMSGTHEENFADGSQTAKFVKVISLEKYPAIILYLFHQG